MNFLAHLYLSGSSEKVMIGNFIADFVKGSQVLQFEPEIRFGIALHREIDQFTDQHEVVLRSTERLKPTQKRYAPVVVDIFYDHFLALNWEKYSEIPLLDYTLAFYEISKTYWNILPEGVKKMLPMMQKDNWLYNYRKISGIEKVFEGMSNRTSFVSNMLAAPKDLVKDYEAYNTEFKAYFPDIQSFCKEYLVKNL